MSELERLEARAREKRARFGQTLRSLEERATVLGVADEMIVRAGGSPRAREIVEALKRNPVLAIGLALCAGLLILDINKARKSRMLNGKGRPIADRTAVSRTHRTQEIYHGD